MIIEDSLANALNIFGDIHNACKVMLNVLYLPSKQSLIPLLGVGLYVDMLLEPPQ